MRRDPRFSTLLLLLGGLAALLLTVGYAQATSSNRFGPTVQTDDWPAYMNGGAHQSFNLAEATINQTTASSLRPLWISDTTAGTGYAPIVAAPALADGALYIGNWISSTTQPNFFKLDANTGQTLASTNLGYLNTGTSGCNPSRSGVSSGAAVAGNTVYVGGADNWFYALNTADLSLRWKWNTAYMTSTQYPTSTTYNGNYNWSSPVVYSGSVYVGVASYGDCPLVRGRLLKLDANSGALQDQFAVPDTTPPSAVGGGIWTSPSIETATNSIVVVTGNRDETVISRTGAARLYYTEAILKFSISDISTPTAHWKLPFADLTYDPDFGTSVDLFSKNGRNYAATINKNGKLYIFDTADIAAGPISTTQISRPNGPPQGGYGDLSSAGFYNGRLYVAGPKTALDGLNVGGSLGALDVPTATDFLWRKGTAPDLYPAANCEPDSQGNCLRTAGMVLAPVTGAPGVVQVGAAWETQLRDSETGELLYTSKVVTNTSLGWQTIYGGAAIGAGKMYIPATSGKLFAYAPGFTRSDQFGLPGLGSHWYVRNPLPSNYSLSAGALHITTTNQPSNTLGYAANFLAQWPLGGDAAAWTITTSLSFNPTAAQQQAGLAAYQDASNNFTFARVYSGGNYLMLRSVLTGTELQNVLIADNPTLSPTVYLQLSKGRQLLEPAAGTPTETFLTSVYTAAYSYDGATWTTVPVTRSAYLGQVQVGLYANSGLASAPAVRADFDYFLISPNNGLVSNPTPTPTSTATVPPTNTPSVTPTASRTATGVPTNTPLATGTASSTATASPTSTPTTSTPTATATTCTLRFTDVPTNSIFYGDIQYLACRGLVGGFPNLTPPGSYRYEPNTNTTRGQFAKVATLAFALPAYTPPTPSFTDVASGSIFYAYIEAASHAGAVNGLAAGQCVALGVQPPCYGPNVLITRAQVAVITKRARNYPDFTPASPSFSDVPANNFAYLAIETLYQRAIISGATCSGGSTLCFRPNDNIKRGELAKVVRRAIESN